MTAVKRFLLVLAGLLLGMPAYAGTLSPVCGPGATSPSGCTAIDLPPSLGTFNQLIQSINTTLAPSGAGNLSPALTVPTVASAVNGFKLTPSITGSPVILGIGGINPDTNIDMVITPGGTGVVEFGSSGSTAPNSNIAVSVTSLGPAGSHTTIQEWFAFKNSAGTVRYVPAY